MRTKLSDISLHKRYFDDILASTEGSFKAQEILRKSDRLHRNIKLAAAKFIKIQIVQSRILLFSSEMLSVSGVARSHLKATFEEYNKPTGDRTRDYTVTVKYE